LIEFSDVDERRAALARMKGIEDRCWVQVGAHERAYAIADEDMERENDDKTSSVHFLRFDLDIDMCRHAKQGKPLQMGIDHPAYRHEVGLIPEPVRAALARDLA
jgi:hypothetical protein